MPVTKLSISVLSSQSEVVKGQVIAAANATGPNSATVIRDANGKVIRVEVNLPSTAAAAATTAIESNSGVAAVEGEELPPGTIGSDNSSAEVYAAMLTLPGVSEYDMGDYEVTYDGDAQTVDMPDWITSMVQRVTRQLGNVAIFPDFSFEWKCKVLPGLGETGVSGVVGAAAATSAGMFSLSVNGEGAVRVNSATNVLTTIKTLTGADYHTFKLQIIGTTTKAFIDGVEEYSGSIYPNQPGNYWNFRVQNPGSTVDTDVVIDYIRWTTV